jgi:hypothetical protein
MEMSGRILFQDAIFPPGVIIGDAAKKEGL